MLLFYTAQITYEGEERISVARKRLPSDSSEGLEFAPSWELLAPAIKLRQQGLETESTWQAYTASYTEEMRDSYRKHGEAWQRLLERPRAVLCCYCDLAKHPGRCHRLLLAEMLRKCGAVYLGELPLAGYERANQLVGGWLDMSAAQGLAR